VKDVLEQNWEGTQAAGVAALQVSDVTDLDVKQIQEQ